ncbi:MAG: flagellar M-ring protein FliF [Blautia sp.]|nr:flagellar M-ring protein FliF [Blautia sp.]
MADRLKQIPAKVLEWWNKFTTKQKTIIIAIAAVVIFTFAIIIYAFTRPQYTRFGTYEDTKVAAEVIEILQDAGIKYKESPDLLTIDVEKSQLSEANYALASQGYRPQSLDYSAYMSSGMSTTNSDRERQYGVWLQAELQQAFGTLQPIREILAYVNLPRQDGTLMADKEEASAYIQLTLNGSLTSSQAAAIARSAATMLGNETTANITIMDQDANLLFAGGDDYGTAGVANSMHELQNQAQSMLSNQVRRVFYGTKQYDMVEVTSHLVVNFSNYEEAIKEYSAPDGRDQGMLAERQQFESESTNGLAGVPGTDSNGEGGNLNTYVNPDSAYGESSSTETAEKFLPNEYSRIGTSLAGSIDYDSSSMAIALISYHEYYEEQVDAQGLLDGISWEEFKAAHSEDVRLSVDDEFYDMAANAAGIDRERITIIAYESPMFFDKEGLNVRATDVVSIVMIILILALLVLVVLRSMRSRKDTTEEEELSVESMLQSNPSEVEDIDVEAKSETRKMIEKFVDENPDAAANLLRNWLNEDWG